ncbi:metallophosphoesterase family protein [uncultured Desulfosarcina sp.]|uniref:metallophosphoesterase family protein n=1 Tax=uncultured Desulfosarcina sp. TaxID=218289 RepID=UPI0029C7B609|nr:metallophosphoesterase family protein [uncultured Desulfosarcina sp.]
MSLSFHHKIGIMADSHGDPESIDKGAVFLKQSDCTTLVHLGDICDSNCFDTADACVDRVKALGIAAVKGNNDHTLTADARGRKNTGIRPETLSFLEDLPLSLTVGRATFVHSRPFVKRLGLSAMIGTVGKRDAEKYFKENPDGLLLRGHSHTPEMICRIDNQIRFASLIAGQTVELAGKRPCIVTCGALTSGVVMLWESGEDCLTCCSFNY